MNLLTLAYASDRLKDDFDLVKITEANQVISEVEVWLGQKNSVQVYSKQNIYKTI